MNASNSNSSYVFSPISPLPKILIAIGMCSCAMYGLVANWLILYFIAKQKSPLGKRYVHSRQKLVNRFIQSLAFSDVLCCTFSVPLFTVEMMTDLIQTDLECKLIRAVTMPFAVVTVMNYIVIGIHRYVAVFYPFSLKIEKHSRKVVIGAWVSSFFLLAMILPSYKLVRFDLEDTYTLICKYDNSSLTSNVAFLVFIIIGYVIPFCVLAFATISIIFFVRRRKVRFNQIVPQNHPNGECSSPNTAVNMKNLKLTKMFIKLIVTFVIPYISFILYSGVVMVLKRKVSFELDYIIRHVYSLLVFSNGAISSTILFKDSRYLKSRIKKAISN